MIDFDYSSPGSGHKDSLLNGKNRDALKELVTNLRYLLHIISLAFTSLTKRDVG